MKELETRVTRLEAAAIADQCADRWQDLPIVRIEAGQLDKQRNPPVLVIRAELLAALR